MMTVMVWLWPPLVGFTAGFMTRRLFGNRLDACLLAAVTAPVASGWGVHLMLGR